LDQEADSYAKGAFKLDLLREHPKERDPRENLAAKAREELAEWEREQAERFQD
jgi:hypothetical protein